MSIHLTELHIENFRGIKNLELNNFSHINILSGINNSGKTSILEAMLSLSYTRDIEGLYDIAYNRGSEEEFKWLFNISSNYYKLKAVIDKKDVEYSVSYEKEIIPLGELKNYVNENLESKAAERLIKQFDKRNSVLQYDSSLETAVYNIKYKGETEQKTILNKYLIAMYRIIFSKKRVNDYLDIYNFKCVKIGVVDHLNRNIVLEIGKKLESMNKVTELLKIFDSNIQAIGLTIDDEFSDESKLTIKHKLKGEMPISVYGDGIKRIISLADAIISAENGILLIDEIETSVHKSVLESTFEWLIKASMEYNVQIFLTTHSLEVCDTILEVSDKLSSSYDNEELVSMITLFNVNDNIVARVLDGATALKMRENYDMELR